RWAIPGILRRKVEAADLARLAHGQKPGKQSALTAPRTPAAERGAYRRYRREMVGSTTQMVHSQRNLAFADQPTTPALPLPHQYTQTNRKSQTTSTKCQYQAAASKPK